MSTQQLIVGLGTGRCGTRSLRKLLSMQQDVTAIHERNPHLAWENEPDPGRHLRYGKGFGSYVFADIGFYYLPHVGQLRDEFPGVRFVCLQRDRDETIASFMNQRIRGNGWFCPGVSGWARSFPVLDGDFEDQVAAYWDLYYERAEQLAGDDFIIFQTEALSDYRAYDILDFCGVASSVVEPCHVGIGQP